MPRLERRERGGRREEGGGRREKGGGRREEGVYLNDNMANSIKWSLH